jgi:peptidoglycan-associated lipoprotein
VSDAVSAPREERGTTKRRRKEAMRKRQVFWVPLVTLLVTVLVMTGCRRGVVKTEFPGDDRPRAVIETPPPPPRTTGRIDEGTVPEPDVRRLSFRPETDLATIHFEFDKSSITEEARAILESNAEIIKENPDVIIQIEGHCDERGANEYNLALGHRRAMATRDYLIELGVFAGRLATISYGEERPIDAAHNEKAWAKNRRAQFREAE